MIPRQLLGTELLDQLLGISFDETGQFIVSENQYQTTTINVTELASNSDSVYDTLEEYNIYSPNESLIILIVNLSQLL